MAPAAVLLASALLAYRGWIVLQRRQVHAVLLLVLAFYGLSFAFAYEELELFDPDAAALAAAVFGVGALVLMAALAGWQSLVASTLARAPAQWTLRFRETSQAHLRYAGGFLLVSLALFFVFRQDFGATWEDARVGTNPMLVTAPFFMFLGCPGVVSALRRSKVVFLGYLAAVVCVFVFSGSRAGVLTAMAFYAWQWLSLHGQRRALLNPRALATFALLGVAVFALHAVLRGLRSFSPADLFALLAAGNFAGLVTAVADASGGAGLTGSESTINQYFVFAVYAADDDVYGMLTSVQRLLTMFLPGSFFPEKPMDVSYRLWADAWLQGLFVDSPYRDALAQMYRDGAYGSLHPTLFGELFLAGRWLGLVLSVIFMAGVCVLVEYMLVRLRPLDALLLLGPTLVGMAMIARGNSVIGFGYFFYLLPIVLVTTGGVRLVKRFLRESRA